MDYKDSESSVQILITDKKEEKIIGGTITAFYKSDEIALERVSDVEGMIYIPKTLFKDAVSWRISYTGFKDLVIKENLASKFVHVKLGERLVGLDAVGAVYIEGQTWVGEFSEDKIELPLNITSSEKLWVCYEKIK